MKKLFAPLLVAVFILGAAPAHPEGWRQALPGYRYQFPRDHGAHEAFRTEWWYFSGNLQDAGGEKYSFMLTFFRVGLRPGAPPKSKSRWALRNLYFGHFSVLDAKREKHRFSERISRGALEQAGASEGGLKVWLRDWRAESMGEKGPSSFRISRGDAPDEAAPGTEVSETSRDSRRGWGEPEGPGPWPRLSLLFLYAVSREGCSHNRGAKSRRARLSLDGP